MSESARSKAIDVMAKSGLEACRRARGLHASGHYGDGYDRTALIQEWQDVEDEIRLIRAELKEGEQ
jgi:hypothetical protein